MKTTSGTERKRYAFDNAPRCGARTKHNNGLPCRCPAIKGKTRCRIHGCGKSSGAKKGNINAVKTGLTTAAVKEFKKNVRQAITTNRHLIKQLGQ